MVGPTAAPQSLTSSLSASGDHDRYLSRSTCLPGSFVTFPFNLGQATCHLRIHLHSAAAAACRYARNKLTADSTKCTTCTAAAGHLTLFSRRTANSRRPG